MKKIIFFIMILIESASSYSQSLPFEWVKTVGSGTKDSYGQYVTTDASGNVFITGNFYGTIDFDPGPGVFNLSAIGSDLDIFIVKLDVSGNFVWAKRLGGGENDYVSAIAADAAGNVYTTGYFFGTSDFDPGPSLVNLTATGGSLTSDVFISKLDASGNYVWAKSFGGNGNDQGKSIAIDPSGNVFTTGYFWLTADFDPGAGIMNLGSVGSEDVFISKLDVSGNFMWAKGIGGLENDEGNGIATDAGGNVYTTGSFLETADFDPGAGVVDLTSDTSVSIGTPDIFISKLDASGNYVWAKRIGGKHYDYGNAIELDSGGMVYTTGFFEDTVDFDSGAAVNNLISDPGSMDMFISKLDSLGNFVWAKRVGSIVSGNANAMAMDASGSVYVTGSFNGTADFDPGAGTFYATSTLLVSGAFSDDVFILKLDNSGNFMWVANFGGPGPETSTSINVDPFGNVYTIGGFIYTVDFDPGVGTDFLTETPGQNIFIEKLGELQTGINENSNDNFSFIYPNPNNGDFIISSNAQIIQTIIVRDALGRIVK
ncbi:MAG: SBBP repeat-containing protein, partial [Bacteroidia bacterium]